jgi:hypothetical protein
MPHSRWSSRASVTAETDAQQLATRVLTMQAEAGFTIAMRMPMLFKGALGDRRGQREATKAIVEKVSAVAESGMAATHAATTLWWSLALTPACHFDFAAAAVKVADSTLEPFARRTRANAARLGGSRR